MAKPKNMVPGPDEDLIRESLQLATNVCILKYSVRYVPLNALNPTDWAEIPDHFVEEVAEDPWSVPPIVVGKRGRPRNTYDIVDGHHRYQAFLQAGFTHMWAIVIDQGMYC